MPSPKFVGKICIIQAAIALETAVVGSLSWMTIGATRGLTLTSSWETVDATARDSPGNTKESLVTFIGVEISADGVAYGEAVTNQKALRSHVYNPGAGTDNQPKVWLRITDPDGSTYVGPFIIGEFSDERPHDDVATWSMSASSNGAFVYTPT
jgi:predicted secreted protein